MPTDQTFLNGGLDRLINSVLTGITFLFKQISEDFKFVFPIFYDNHFNVIWCLSYKFLSLKEVYIVYH